MEKPDILFIMCDQFRYDAIAAHGNERILTPNLDKLVQEGKSYHMAYSNCPVCVPARYSIMSGCMPCNTGIYSNLVRSKKVKERCGEYLASVMSKAGYRTFGIGKFHTSPFDEDLGFDIQLRSEELWNNLHQRYELDDYAKYIHESYPEYSHIEQLQGERTDMYYMPQTRALPEKCCAERWLTERAKEQLNSEDKRPYFGFLSFIQPHPPCAPPIPYNRMYDPDDMENPVSTNKEIDFSDEQIPFMNRLIWADEINPFLARSVKARYYGEISYIDNCIGEILDSVRARGNIENTVIFFFADHGDHMGDHHAWQKESFFDQSAKIPFIVWCGKNIRQKPKGELACLTDLFAMATSLAGVRECRDGVNLFERARQSVYGIYGEPGTRLFKCMVRNERYKYIYLSNGGRELLFDMQADPDEKEPVDKQTVLIKMRNELRDVLLANEQTKCMVTETGMVSYPYQERETKRIRQFDLSSGVKDFTVRFKG